MHFASPWAFLLLLLIPPLLWWRMRQPEDAVRFSSVHHAGLAGRSVRQRLSILPVLLRAAALCLLVVALARPQRGTEQVRDVSQGIAIQMVIDRSSSMSEEMTFDGERVNRLEAVKRVFHDFVLGDDAGLQGRPNDLVGMISFARYADTICPLTLAHDALPNFLETVNLVTQRQEDGTAIGDAIALAAARLKTAEESLTDQSRSLPDAYQIQSKVIILLTDGENTAGERHPVEAAKLAAEWGIKIYTIAVGSDAASGQMRRLFGSIALPTRSSVDTALLGSIAEVSGGAFRLATNADSLREIYQEIDRLEKTDVESLRYVDYREIFAPFALLALGIIGVEAALGATLFRRIP